MGGGKFSVACCKPVGLMQVDGKDRGSVVISAISPSLLQHASTQLAGTMLLRTYHHPHSSLNKPCARLSEMLVRNYHYTLCNNLE